MRFLEIVYSLEGVDQSQVEEFLGLEGFTRFFVERVEGGAFLKIYLLPGEDVPQSLHGLVEIERRWIEPDDWLKTFLETLEPFELVPGVLVVPGSGEAEAKGYDVVIKLTPGVAFGTGLHPTTQMSAQLLVENMEPGDEVADVGCGTGILSVLAAKLGASKVVAVDSDPIAVMKAREVVKENGVEVEVIEGNLLDGVVGRFDLVVSNIYAEVLLRLLEGLDPKLKPRGKVVLSGIVPEKLGLVKRKAEELGFTISEEREESGWCALLLTR